MTSLPSIPGKREDAYHPKSESQGPNPLKSCRKGAGRVLSSTRGFLLRECPHVLGELGKRTVKHTQAGLGHLAARGGVAAVGACGGVEAGNDAVRLLDRQPHFFAPRHTLVLGKNVPSLHQEKLRLPFGVTYFCNFLCPCFIIYSLSPPIYLLPPPFLTRVGP